MTTPIARVGSRVHCGFSVTPGSARARRLKTPKVGSIMKMKVIATGTSGIAQGTVRRLRTAPRPGNWRFIRRATPRPLDEDDDVDEEGEDEGAADDAGEGGVVEEQAEVREREAAAGGLDAGPDAAQDRVAEEEALEERGAAGSARRRWRRRRGSTLPCRRARRADRALRPRSSVLPPAARRSPAAGRVQMRAASASSWTWAASIASLTVPPGCSARCMFCITMRPNWSST